MFSKKFVPLKNPSPWRRLSMATWKAPNDPTIYGKVDFDATPLIQFLEEINRENPNKITITHLIAKAAALTLHRYPDINGIIRWKRIYLRKTVDLFIQVALPESAPGEKPDLSGAKIESCETKSLQEIARELVDKSQKIRKKEDPQFKSSHHLLNQIPSLFLTPMLKLMGFLIYNLGIIAPRFGLPEDPFGSAMITSVGSLNTPSGFAPLVPVSRCPFIICIGAVCDKPWIVDGSVSVRPVVDLSFTLDHRFIDGLTGARMFHYLKEILAEPKRFL